MSVFLPNSWFLENSSFELIDDNTKIIMYVIRPDKSKASHTIVSLLKFSSFCIQVKTDYSLRSLMLQGVCGAFAILSLHDKVRPRSVASSSKQTTTCQVNYVH